MHVKQLVHYNGTKSCDKQHPHAQVKPYIIAPADLSANPGVVVVENSEENTVDSNSWASADAVLHTLQDFR